MAAVTTATGLIEVTDRIYHPPTTARLLVLDETDSGRRCHKQRSADAVVAAAAQAGYTKLTAGSCGNYGLAIAQAAARVGLPATVVVPASFGQADVGSIRDLGARVIRVGETYEDAVSASRRLAAECGAADANVDGPFAPVVVAALGEIVAALDGLPTGPPAGLWVPLGNGTTVAAVAAAVLRRGWSTAVFGASSPGNNSVLASWPSQRHRRLRPPAVSATAVNEPLVNWDALHGQQALDVLHRTGGSAIGIIDAALVTASETIRHAGLRASPAGAAGVAAMSSALSHTGLAGGSHVAVLTG